MQISDVKGQSVHRSCHKWRKNINTCTDRRQHHIWFISRKINITQCHLQFSSWKLKNWWGSGGPCTFVNGWSEYLTIQNCLFWKWDLAVFKESWTFQFYGSTTVILNIYPSGSKCMLSNTNRIISTVSSHNSPQTDVLLLL